jgi:hypothetical protein
MNLRWTICFRHRSLQWRSRRMTIGYRAADVLLDRIEDAHRLEDTVTIRLAATLKAGSSSQFHG